MKRLLVVPLLLLAAACGSNPVTAGTVVGRQYHPPQDYNTQEPVYGQHCTTVEEYNSTTKTSYPQVSCTSYVMYYMSVPHHDDAYYTLRLKSCKADQESGKEKCRFGDVEVDQSDYHNIQGGSFYDSKKGS